MLKKLQSEETTKELFSRISRFMTSIVNRLFNKRGGKFGRPAWPGLSSTMLGRIRKGTDGQKHGRYHNGVELMKASGLYYRSFKTLSRSISSSKSTMKYGSDHPMADDLPFGTWNRKDGITTPRHTMPDPNSTDFKTSFDGLIKKTARDMVRKATSG